MCGCCSHKRSTCSGSLNPSAIGPQLGPQQLAHQHAAQSPHNHARRPAPSNLRGRCCQGSIRAGGWRVVPQMWGCAARQGNGRRKKLGERTRLWVGCCTVSTLSGVDSESLKKVVTSPRFQGHNQRRKTLSSSTGIHPQHSHPAVLRRAGWQSTHVHKGGPLAAGGPPPNATRRAAAARARRAPRAGAAPVRLTASAAAPAARLGGRGRVTQGWLSRARAVYFSRPISFSTRTSSAMISFSMPMNRCSKISEGREEEGKREEDRAR